MKKVDSCNSTKKHRIFPVKLRVLFFLFLVIPAVFNTALGQAVYVDKVDYMPGDVVIINGYSWQPGEVVSVVLSENYLNPEGVVITTKSFTCDSQGKFGGSLYTVVEANLGALFQVKATGNMSNHVCTTVFHDAGGDYSIDYSAYDPEYYQRLEVSDFAAGYFPLEGNHVSPLGSGGTEGYTMHTHTVESLNPQFLGLGQIVAFEFYVSADAAGACTNDVISFGGSWSTVTQNNGNFGFDPAYMVLAAFVDPSSETNFQDGGTPASARIQSSVLNGDDIEAMIEVSGLDPGDKFPVEVWLVLKDRIADGVGSNVPTGAINGLTLGSCETGEAVKMGNQTVPLLQAGSFFTTDVDVSIIKTDSQDPIAIGDPFYYTMTVSNSGPSVGNNIVITDLLNSNFNLDVDAITFSHEIASGYADDLSWGHTFDITTHTLTLTKLSIDIGETIYIRIPVSWISPYTGTRTPGAAGPGAPGSTCSGDLINSVAITTISSDTNLANNSYCQPTNVYCTTVTANAGPDKELTCTITSVILEGSTSQNVSYSWIASNGGNIVSGEDTATPTVNAAGTYTLTVTDLLSGCSATDFAVVTLNNTPPDVDAGPDKVLTCSVTSVVLNGSSETPGVTYQWTTSDGHFVSASNIAEPTVDAAGTYTLTVTAPNGCTATDNAIVTLNNTPPDVNAGDDKVLNCIVTSVVLNGSSTTPEVTYQWTTSDGHFVSASNIAEPTVDAAGTYTLTVTAPNGCTATDNAEVTLDNTVPNVNAGPDKILNCTITSVMLEGSSSTEEATFSWSGPGIVSGGATATPIVNVAGTYTLTVTAPNGCTATDNAEVTLNNTPPNVNAGPDKSVSCAVEPVTLEGSSSTEGVTFAWIASNGGHIVSGETSATPVVDASGTYTLTVTDPSNGCTASDFAIVVLERDTEPPVIECPDPINVTCASEVPDPVLPSAVDNCGKAAVEWIGDEISDQTCENRFVITRTFRATDENELTSECRQIITVYDDVAPVLTLPSEFHGLRGPNCTWNIDPSVTGQATAIDNCGEQVEVTYTDEYILLTECSKHIKRTWSAVDNCGNKATGIQDIYYTDEAPPVLVIPPDYNGLRGPNCEWDINPSTTGKASATDNCDQSVDITYSDEFIQLTECKKIIKRTWIAEDNCDNKATGVQMIYYTEETPPKLVVPPDYNGLRGPNCEYDTDPVITGQATATDNCDKSVDITYSDEFILATECKKIIERTWKAVDNCGNIATGIQTLNFTETTPPVLIVPADYYGSKGAGCEINSSPSITGQATASDNCDKSVDITYTDVIASANDCNKVISRIWKAVDNCGNMSTAKQTLTFVDDTDPEIMLVDNKTEYTIEGCDTDFRLPKPEVSDNCDNDVLLKAYVGSAEIDLSTYKFEKEGTTTVTFEADDNCGNTATATVNVTRNPCVESTLSYGESKDFSEIRFKVFPNPFVSMVKFEICLPYDSFTRIDIFTYNGTFVTQVLNEDLMKNEVRTIEFDGSRYPGNTIFIYRVTTKITWFNGTIVRSR